MDFSILNKGFKMTDISINDVSAYVVKYIIRNAVSMLTSVTGNLSNDIIEKIINKRTEDLTSISFSNKNDIGQVVELIISDLNTKETENRSLDEMIDESLRDNDDLSSELLHISSKMATQINSAVSVLRGTVAPKAEKILNEIMRVCESPVNDSNDLPKLDMFNWGILSDDTFITEMKLVCQTTANVFNNASGTMYASDAEACVNKAYSYINKETIDPYDTREDVIKRVAKYIAKTCDSDDSDFYYDTIDRIRRVLDVNERMSSHIGAVSSIINGNDISVLIDTVDRLSTELSDIRMLRKMKIGGIEGISPEHADIINRNINSVYTVVVMLFGALYIYKNTKSQHLIIPTNLSRYSDTSISNFRIDVTQLPVLAKMLSDEGVENPEEKALEYANLYIPYLKVTKLTIPRLGVLPKSVMIAGANMLPAIKSNYDKIRKDMNSSIRYKNKTNIELILRNNFTYPNNQWAIGDDANVIINCIDKGKPAIDVITNIIVSEYNSPGLSSIHSMLNKSLPTFLNVSKDGKQTLAMAIVDVMSCIISTFLSLVGSVKPYNPKNENIVSSTESYDPSIIEGILKKA